MEQIEHPLFSLQRRLDGLRLKSLSPQPLLSDGRTVAAQQLGTLCTLAMGQLVRGVDLFDVNTRIFVSMMMATLPAQFNMQASQIASVASMGQSPRNLDEFVLALMNYAVPSGYNQAKDDLNLRLVFASEAFATARAPMESSLPDYMGLQIPENPRDNVNIHIRDVIRTNLMVAWLDVRNQGSLDDRVDQFLNNMFDQKSPAPVCSGSPLSHTENNVVSFLRR